MDMYSMIDRISNHSTFRIPVLSALMHQARFRIVLTAWFACLCTTSTGIDAATPDITAQATSKNQPMVKQKKKRQEKKERTVR